MKKAFTLAEVLITLGIIGVVAAMTMPTLIANHQKEVVATSLRKAYAELNLALQMSISKYGDVSTWDYQSADDIDKWAATYIAPNFKVLSSGSCSSNRKPICMGVPLAGNLGASSYLYSGNMIAPYLIVTAGGAAKAFAFYKYNSYNEVRVYAYLKLPNDRKAMKGKEVFTFVLNPSKDAAFKPFGVSGTVPFTTGSISRETLLKGPIRAGGCYKGAGGPDYYTAGDSCGAVIMMDGWKIKPDYPW